MSIVAVYTQFIPQSCFGHASVSKWIPKSVVQYMHVRYIRWVHNDMAHNVTYAYNHDPLQAGVKVTQNDALAHQKQACND